MANAVSVKGMKGMIAKLADEVLDAAKRAAKQDQPEYKCTGTFRVKGPFGFTKDGELGVVGRADVDFSEGVEGVEAEAGVSGDSGMAFSSFGSGELDMYFEVVVIKGAGASA